MAPWPCGTRGTFCVCGGRVAQIAGIKKPSRDWALVGDRWPEGHQSRRSIGLIYHSDLGSCHLAAIYLIAQIADHFWVINISGSRRSIVFFYVRNIRGDIQSLCNSLGLFLCELDVCVFFHFNLHDCLSLHGASLPHAHKYPILRLSGQALPE